jgi:hypothetical protein
MLNYSSKHLTLSLFQLNSFSLQSTLLTCLDLVRVGQISSYQGSLHNCLFCFLLLVWSVYFHRFFQSLPVSGLLRYDIEQFAKGLLVGKYLSRKLFAKVLSMSRIASIVAKHCPSFGSGSPSCLKHY